MYSTYTDVLVYSGSPPAKHAEYILLNRLNLQVHKTQENLDLWAKHIIKACCGASYVRLGV